MNLKIGRRSLRWSWSAVAALAMVVASAATLAAQEAADPSALRSDVERRFDVLPLRDGLLLQPRNRASGARTVELAGETIAVDGRVVTGAELHDTLGSDADVVLRLSYLPADVRRRLFAPAVAPEQESRPPAEAPTVESAPAEAPRNVRRSGERVKFGGSVTIDADEAVDGDVVVLGGAARVNGEITGDLVVVGGPTVLGPTAHVHGDVTAVLGSLRRDPAARVGGAVKEVGAGGFGSYHGWRGRPGDLFFWPWAWGSLFALVSTVMRFAVLSLLVCLALLLGPEYVDRVGARAAAEPLKAGLVGILAQLLFFPVLVFTVVLLVVTIIGIPLLALIPFALFALAVFFLMGFAGVAYRLGRFVNARLGWTPQNPYAAAVLGILVVLSPVLVGRAIGLIGGLTIPFTIALAGFGLALEYLAWTVGLGAVALQRFDKKTA